MQISPDRVSLNLQGISLGDDKVPRVFHASPCGLHLPETAPEIFLVTLAVREARAGRLCAADAAAVQTPVHFWLVEAKHLRVKKNTMKRCYSPSMTLLKYTDR